MKAKKRTPKTDFPPFSPASPAGEAFLAPSPQIKRPRRAPESAAENPLPRSLETLTADEIQPLAEPAGRNKRHHPIHLLIYALLIAVIAWSLFSLVEKQISKYQTNRMYDELRDLFHGADDGGGGRFLKAMTKNDPIPDLASAIGGEASYAPTEEESGSDTLQRIKIKLEQLQAINRDVYGWIKIVGTRIDYPLVQGKDNAYYLNRAFNGTYQFSGSLFVDYTNEKKIADNRNTVIYGHNMQDGTMFRTLINFKDRAMFDAGVVEIVTNDGIFYYEVFSFHLDKDTSNFFQTAFESDEAFLVFCEEMQSKSIYKKKNIKFDKDSKIITLSTCTNINDDERYAAHAILVRSITDEENGNGT